MGFPAPVGWISGGPVGATADCGPWWWRAYLILSCPITLGCALGSHMISNIRADFMSHGVGHAGGGWPEVVGPTESGQTVRMEDWVRVWALLWDYVGWPGNFPCCFDWGIKMTLKKRAEVPAVWSNEPTSSARFMVFIQNKSVCLLSMLHALSWLFMSAVYQGLVAMHSNLWRVQRPVYERSLCEEF